MKTVSIVVPVYNVESDLRQCVESVLAQSYQFWELWLVDDGSTDASPTICDDYACKDDRIHVIHKVNGGVSSARNVGIENITGEYTLFLDSDDYLEANTLDRLVNCAVSTEADIVLCGFKHRVMSDNSVEEILSNCPFEGNNETFFNTCFWDVYQKDLINPPWNKLIRSEILTEYQIKFNENYSILEDVAFSVQVMEHSSKLVVLQEALYNYCFKQQGNLVHKFHENFFAALLYLDSCLEGYFSSEPQCDMEQMRKRIFFQKTLAYLRKMYRASGYNNEKKYKELLSVCNNIRLQGCIEAYQCGGISKKAVIFLIKKRMYRVLHWLYLIT